MGRQVEIYVTNDDLGLLEDAIKRLGPTTFMKSEWKSPTPELAQTLRVTRRGQERWRLYLCRDPDVASVTTTHVDVQNFWQPDVMKSPVIEMDRSYFDGVVCARGRLYYINGYYLEDGSWANKPDSFLRWADSVLRMARRTLHRDPELEAYLGPEAIRLRKEGSVKLPLKW